MYRNNIIKLAFRSPGQLSMAAFRRLSCRIGAIALAFFCLVVTSSYSWGVQCRCCNHDKRHCTHHDAKHADTWTSPVNEYSNTCQSVYISRSSICNEQIVSDIKLVAAAVQTNRADSIQTEYRPTTFSFRVLPVLLISKNLRL